MSESSSIGDTSALTLRIKFKSDSYDAFVERYGGDVSPGGIFIRSRQPLAVGTKIKFHLTLMTEVPVLDGSGTVVWVRQSDPQRSGSSSPGMGIRFDLLSQESKERLNRILAAKAKMEQSASQGRGPSPIPDGPFGGPPIGSPDAAEKTSKMRISDKGEVLGPASVTPMAKGGMGVATVAGRPSPLAARDSFHDKPTAAGANFSEPTRQGSAPAAVQQASRSDFDDKPETPVFGAKVNRNEPAQGGLAQERPAFPTQSTRAGAPAPDLLNKAGGVRSFFARRTPLPAAPATRAGGGKIPEEAFRPDAIRGAGASVPASPFAAAPSAPQKVQSPARAPTPAPNRVPTPPPLPLTPKRSLTPPPFTPPPMATGPIMGGAAALGRVPVTKVPSSEANTPKPMTIPTPVPAQTFAPVAKTGGAWSVEEKTEINTQLPTFGFDPDELAEDMDSAVHGQALPGQSGLQLPIELGHPQALRRLTPRPPVDRDGFDGAPTQSARGVGPAGNLGGLFDGEQFGDPGAGPPTVRASALPGSDMAPSQSSSSMVARKVTPLKINDGPPRGRLYVWLGVGALAVGVGVFVLVQIIGGNGPLQTTMPSPYSAVVASGAGGPEPTPKPAEPAPVQDAPPPAEDEQNAAPAVEEPPPAKAAPKPAPPPVSKPTRPSRKVSVQNAPAKSTPPVAKAAVPVAPKPTAEEGPEEDLSAIHWLKIRSTPSGASVFIDGIMEGKTPFQRRMFDTSRPYSVSVRKDGFDNFERMLSASDSWTKSGTEYVLNIMVKMQGKAAPAPAATPEAPDKAAPAPAAEGDLESPF